MIGTTKAAKLLNISARRLRYLLAQNRVDGTFKLGRNWAIPTVNGYPKIKTASHGPKATWKKVKTPAQNVVHINRQLIGKKMNDGKFAPVISVKFDTPQPKGVRILRSMTGLKSRTLPHLTLLV
ncbi:MAG: hypothetical protein VKN72_07650 [Nostocales cyanobacterium 94392]|nr:hypothetical protein [Nostocales cyanobacterium 94392]